MPWLHWATGGWFDDIKMSSYQYTKYHCGEQMILRQSYLHSGISYTGKMSKELHPLIIIAEFHQSYQVFWSFGQVTLIGTCWNIPCISLRWKWLAVMVSDQAAWLPSACPPCLQKPPGDPTMKLLGFWLHIVHMFHCPTWFWIVPNNKVWWLCLVPTSTTTFACDVGYTMETFNMVIQGFFMNNDI